MKKILIFGKLNEVVKDINKMLSEHFYVQLCEINAETAEGMMKVVEPDLVIICLVGAMGIDENIFRVLSKNYSQIPVITVGTEKEKFVFEKYYLSGQFENLTRPVENKDILSTVCKKLNYVLVEEGNRFLIKDKLAKRTVLIVDDNPVTLRSIREMIKEEFNVIVATSGIQAMTAIGKKRPDLILLDYEMPVCDGRQTLEMIRADEELRGIPVIFLTGIRDRDHIKAVLTLKPQGYLLKPSSKEELITSIKKNIRE